MKARYAAVILAGGLSTRMKQPKPLLQLGEETITDHIVSIFSNEEVDTYLVLGHRQDEVRAGIKKRNITIIYNPDYEQGMFSSVQAGVSHLRSGYQAFFVLPVDIPLVRPATVRRLLDESPVCPDNTIYPVFHGKRGHPPLIPSGLIPSILDWQKPGGLKAVLESLERQPHEVPVPDGNILLDIDSPDDYTAMLKRYLRYEIPTDEECEVILKDVCRVAPDRIRHCLKVSDVAVCIGQALRKSGHEVDIEVVRTAAKLHDIAKGQRKHDIAGGRILRELGFGRVGDVVAVHTDLAGGDTSFSLETKIVYLADKFIAGERLVSLEERYDSSLRGFGLTPEIEAAISGRLEVARNVKAELENLLGCPIEKLISAYA